jgi:hypothetical protein
VSVYTVTDPSSFSFSLQKEIRVDGVIVKTIFLKPFISKAVLAIFHHLNSLIAP